MAWDVVFFPDYRGANPYQHLVYDHAATGLLVTAGGVADALEALRQGDGRHPIVFHLHWEDAVYRNEPDEVAARAASERFLADLGHFIECGGRVLWTLHNAGPHDGRYAAVHQDLVQGLVPLVDIVHVHGPAAAAFARDRYGARPERIAAVAHGNLLPRSRPLAGPNRAERDALDLQTGARVGLFFGRLSAYKGGAELLACFGEAPAPLHLVVAGRQIEPLDAAVAALAPEVRARLRVRDEVVPEAEIPGLFHAADFVVAPYRAIMTSGTVLLALSMGRPVVAPRLEGLLEVLEDGRDAILYETGGLAHALARASELDAGTLARMQHAAAETAARYDWRSLGLLLDGLFHKLRALRRPYRVPRSA